VTKGDTMIATITDKHEQPTANGSHVCTVTCPGCGNAMRRTYGGWSAIVCSGCGVTLYRNKASAQMSKEGET